MRLFLWASVHIRKNRKGNIMNELERLMKRYPQLVGCREAITETYGCWKNLSEMAANF